jgi:hypothetical protein
MQSILNRIKFQKNFKILNISKRYLLNKNQIDQVKSIIGSDNCSSVEAVRQHYSKDESFHQFVFQLTNTIYSLKFQLLKLFLGRLFQILLFFLKMFLKFQFYLNFVMNTEFQ